MTITDPIKAIPYYAREGKLYSTYKSRIFNVQSRGTVYKNILSNGMSKVFTEGRCIGEGAEYRGKGKPMRRFKIYLIRGKVKYVYI